MSIDWPRFVELVRGANSFVLTSHVKPDADALGSELGMAAVLAALGKQVAIVNADPTPPHLAFLDPGKRARVLPAGGGLADVPAHDALLILDTSAWSQLGAMAGVVRATPAVVAVLDHHLSDEPFNALVFKDARIEATGRLVFEAARRLGVKLTKEMAAPLYAALATDTGWFRFDSVTSDTYRAAAELIEAGAEPQALFTALYEQDTLARVKLRARVLARVELFDEGRLAESAVFLADFAATGTAPSDTENVVNALLAIAGVRAAVLMTETTGGFRVSLRGRVGVDCRGVAERFGGGGHRAAAGASVAGDYPSARRQVLDAMRQAMS